ncbi:MAG: LPXTG cell wall anchor domain-containing protein [Ilumatobacteraceae bacterium]
MTAGLLALGVGVSANAAGSGAPTVTPSTGGPGFSFTVTVDGCEGSETVLFNFPPNPPEQGIGCAADATGSTTTMAPASTAATTTEATTTTVTETTVPPCDIIRDALRYSGPVDPCCEYGPQGLVQGGGDESPCDDLSLHGIVMPAQATGVGTASATFTAPQAPGTYQGTVVTGAGTQNFEVTVVAAGPLPETGADDTGTMFLIAVLLVVAGAALFIVAQARRSDAAID